MRVIIGADHRGYALKEKLVGWLEGVGYEVVDVGADEQNQDDDEVDFAVRLVEKMSLEDRGVLLCGSGHGMEIAANRFKSIRAILGFNKQVVVMGREHENANVLSLPAEWVSEEEAISMIESFIKTEFSGHERFVRRLKKIEALGGA